jgi:hypothetical protein
MHLVDPQLWGGAMRCQNRSANGIANFGGRTGCSHVPESDLGKLIRISAQTTRLTATFVLDYGL